MAYLVRDARSRSPYWYGVYLVVSPEGQRRWARKSTKKRKRVEAKEILDAWQKTADRAAAGNLDQFGHGQCRCSARDPPKADRPCERRHEQAVHTFGA